ncbi:hypothetical protein BJV77DRAFT_357500 [Russula vinacea]|nr:hypothetical protein BJV77DRAFT_357500 [Russula vinacea]
MWRRWSRSSYKTTVYGSGSAKELLRSGAAFGLSKVSRRRLCTRSERSGMRSAQLSRGRAIDTFRRLLKGNGLCFKKLVGLKVELRPLLVSAMCLRSIGMQVTSHSCFLTNLFIGARTCGGATDLAEAESGSTYKQKGGIETIVGPWANFGHL